MAPNVLVTYEPSGVYGHSDHIEVSKIVTELAHALKIGLIYSTVAPDYKSSENSLKMAADRSQIKPLIPNKVLHLTFKEYVSKLKALSLYRSQVSLKHEFRHKIYTMYKMLNEYYVV